MFCVQFLMMAESLESNDYIRMPHPTGHQINPCNCFFSSQQWLRVALLATFPLGRQILPFLLAATTLGLWQSWGSSFCWDMHQILLQAPTITAINISTAYKAVICIGPGFGDLLERRNILPFLMHQLNVFPISMMFFEHFLPHQHCSILPALSASVQ